MKPFEGDTHIPTEILKLRQRFCINYVLETGSQYGFTQKWFNENFMYAAGCEINIDFFNYCTEQRLNVMHEGAVKSISICKPFDLYYLDAHGFGFPCPLKDELKAIAEKGHQPVIVIHDFFVPGKDFGYDEYEYKLCFEEIEPLLPAIYPDGYEYHYNTEANGAKRGCIFIYPKA